MTFKLLLGIDGGEVFTKIVYCRRRPG